MKRLFIVLIFILCAAAGLILMPPIFGGHGDNRSDLILNRLRAIDDAKRQWAAEHPDSKGRDPVEQDLAPYLQRLHDYTYFRDEPVAGEKYLIHSLTEPAEAQLTRSAGYFPANANVRWSPDGDIQVRTNNSMPWPIRLHTANPANTL